MGEKARRAMTVGEDAVALFWPSKIRGEKISKTKFAKALCSRKSTNKHNKEPNARGSVEGGI